MLPAEIANDDARGLTLGASVALLANHLEFLDTHRGRIVAVAESWRCDSDRSRFRFTIVGSVAAARAAATQERTVYVPEPLRAEVTAALAPRYAPQGSLEYMTRPLAGASARADAPAPIELVTDLAGMRAFSRAQGLGFCETDAEYREWVPWMTAANVRNLTNPRQRFYISHLAGTPAACLLMVLHAGIAGIYAVATAPA